MRYSLSETDNINVTQSNQNFNELLRNCLKKWHWFIFSIIISIICAYIYITKTQPLYQIKASVVIQDDIKATEQSNLLKDLDVTTYKINIENEIEVLRSNPLISKVIKELNLNVKYYKNHVLGKKEIFSESSPVKLVIYSENENIYKQPIIISSINNTKVKIGSSYYQANKIINTPYGKISLNITNVNDTNSTIIEVFKPSYLANDYSNNLKILPTSKTSSVVEISVEDAFPKRGERFINRLIEEYTKSIALSKNKVALKTLKFIDNRLVFITKELNDIERDIELYKSSQGITNLSTQSEAYLQISQHNDALLNQVNVQLATLNDLQKYIESKSDKPNNAPATIGLNDATLLSLINSLTQLELQREQIGKTVADQSPLIESIDNQIIILKKKIKDNIYVMKSMLLSSKEQYLTKNAQVENYIKSIPKQERSLLNINRQQAIKNNLYNYLLQKREEAAVAMASVVVESQVINPAQSTNFPIKPVKSTIYSLFLLLGLLMPIVLCCYQTFLNGRVIRRKDVESNTNIPILCEIPKSSFNDAIVFDINNQNVVAEQIRRLGIDVIYLAEKIQKCQVLLFTSSISGEGKSFISSNLGASLAKAGKRTIIIDMDMRRPKLHKLLKNENDIGISDYLMANESFGNIIKPIHNIKNYYLITTGDQPLEPTELLNSPKIELLFKELKQSFDYIIIDTPPVGIVADALLLAPFSDATFFIIRHNLTNKNYIRIIESFFVNNRFNNLNIVLNGVNDNGAYHYSRIYKNYYH